MNDYDGYFKALGITHKGPMPWFDFDGEDAEDWAQALLSAIAGGREKDGFGSAGYVARHSEGSVHVLIIREAGHRDMTWKDHATICIAYGADLKASVLWAQRDATTLRISPRAGEDFTWSWRLRVSPEIRYDLTDLAHAAVYAAGWEPRNAFTPAARERFPDLQPYLTALAAVDFVEYQTTRRGRHDVQ